jgi:peptidoglycan/LPS O-acetylase OafA/YrhL
MTSRLRQSVRLPALDGVRALAVIAVMAYHGGVALAGGGFLGVDVFFVLSGYLITSLLLAEWDGQHTIRLRAFWARRARRLLPALLLLLVAVSISARLAAPADTLGSLRADALATLGYVSNWHFIFGGRSYFARAAAPSFLQHTWSLAIEEQFYLLWPIVVVLVVRGGSRGRAKLLLVVAAVATVFSAVEMALLFRPGTDASRVYFGTDTHAQSVLVGAALSIVLFIWRPRLDAVHRRVWSLIGPIGLLLTAWACAAITAGSTWLYRGGFLLVDVAVAALILSLVQSRDAILSKALAWAPLASVGAISYGLYLWHWPVFLVVDATRTGLHGVELLLARVLVTMAIAVLSYHAIEMPIRRGEFRLPAPRVLAPGAVVATVVVIVAATVPPLARQGSPVAAGFATPLAPAVGAFASGQLAPTKLSSTLPSSSLPPTVASTSVVPQPERVLIEGDSVALTLGLGLSVAEASYGMTIINKGILGCGLGGAEWVRDKGRVSRLPGLCAQWTATWSGDVEKYNPAVAAVLIGRWDVMDVLFDGRWTHIGDPQYDSYLEGQLRLAVQALSTRGAQVAFLTMPCENEGEQPNGSSWPQDDSRRIALLNGLLQKVAASAPSKAFVVDLDTIVCPQGRFVSTFNGVQVRNGDGVHFTIPGGVWLAPKLLPQLAL